MPVPYDAVEMASCYMSVRLLLACHDGDLPFFRNPDVRIPLAVYLVDVTTQMPGPRELVTAEVAPLLAALDDDFAFSGPDVVVVGLLASLVRHFCRFW